MKILLRKDGNKYYVWKDAVWDGKYTTADTGEIVDAINILAVAEDDRNNYVQCKHCGKLIENNPESIEAHFKEEEAKKNCLTCPKLVLYDQKKNVDTTYEENADGTFNIVEKYVSRLGCRTSYYANEIHSAQAAAGCIFNQCRKKGVSAINDIFLKYPNLFNKQLTVDALIDKFPHESYDNGYHVYDLKMRSTLFACVNEMGIVDHFVVTFKGWTHTFYYSFEYNKMIFKDYNKYDEDVTSYISGAKADSIKAKLSKLYEEVNTNE